MLWWTTDEMAGCEKQEHMRRSILFAAAITALSGAAIGSGTAQGTYWPWCVDYVAA